MKKRLVSVLLVACMAVSLVVGCGAKKETGGESSEDGVTTVKWMTSRPVDGEIDQVMREIADQYSKEQGGKWKIEIETTADRPSYLQKLKTLIAGNNMPDIIDIDADPYCKELVDAGKLVDVKAFLQENDRYDKFYPTALKYQEFTDGSMYTLPLEYHVEMTWYNKEIFDQYNLTPPKTMDEWLNVCKTLSDNGITPISVDGVDRWPVQRYLAMLPFRESGNDFIINLRDGKAKMNSETGIKAAEFMKEICSSMENLQCIILAIGRLQLCKMHMQREKLIISICR